MNRKMTTNLQLSMTEPKKQKLSELEQEQNHRNGDHMEGYQRGEARRMEEKVQQIRSIIGRHKIDRRRLRIAQEMEKSENLYV